MVKHGMSDGARAALWKRWLDVTCKFQVGKVPLVAMRADAQWKIIAVSRMIWMDGTEVWK